MATNRHWLGHLAGEPQFCSICYRQVRMEDDVGTDGPMHRSCAFWTRSAVALVLGLVWGLASALGRWAADQ